MERSCIGACDALLSPESTSFRSVFFKPYRSSNDALLEASSIVIAPVVLSSLLIVKILALGEALFDDIFTSAPKYENGYQFDYKDCLKAIGVMLLITPFSPLINLAGLIGCSIASLFSDKPKSRVIDARSTPTPG